MPTPTHKRTQPTRYDPRPCRVLTLALGALARTACICMARATARLGYRCDAAGCGVQRLRALARRPLAGC